MFLLQWGVLRRKRDTCKEASPFETVFPSVPCLYRADPSCFSVGYWGLRE